MSARVAGVIETLVVLVVGLLLVAASAVIAPKQTLPPEAPQRSVLILVAFAVAALSLVVQGSTVAPLVRRLSSDDDSAESARRDAAERREVRSVLRRSADGVPAPDRPEGASREELGDIARRHRLAVLAAQRAALLDARDDGVFDADILAHELAGLDATQIAIELRRGGD